MVQPAPISSFRRLITEAQPDLFSFVSLMVGNTPDARDVLQNTNLALIRKAAQYEPDRSFRAWSRSIAYYEVLTFRQTQRRERLVFDDALLDQLSTRLIEEDDVDEAADRRSRALGVCLGKLSHMQRALLNDRYRGGQAVGQIARKRGCSEAAVSSLFYRIRTLLAQCIRREIERREAHG